MTDITYLRARNGTLAASQAPELVASLVEGALAQGDAFFRRLVDALPAAVYVTDVDGRITYFNEAAAELWGCRPMLGESEWCGSWKLFWPDGRALPHDQCPMAQAVKEKRQIRGAEAIAERPDGVRVPFMPFPTPIYDASGMMIGAVNMLVDITDRKRNEMAVQHLASIVESSDDAIVSKDLSIISTWNIGAERLFGYLAEEVIGKHITILIPPHLLQEEATIIDRVRRGQRIEHYETVRQRKHGSLIDISLTVSPIRNAQGKIVGASKIARDISDRKRSEMQITTLAREAEHRTRNILATVQAIVRLSNSDTADDLKQNIAGRIQALANVNTLLVQSRWTGATLHGLVTKELSPYCQANDPRAQIDGPNVMLEPNAAQSIAAALHEMATNAAKHGALSVPDGEIRIVWRHSPDGFVLSWSEMNGPPVVPPKRRGFGMSLMDTMIQGQLKGTLRFDWHPDGFKCEISLPSIASRFLD
jgi:two-component system CheB/CheR fusion protein